MGGNVASRPEPEAPPPTTGDEPKALPSQNTASAGDAGTSIPEQQHGRPAAQGSPSCCHLGQAVVADPPPPYDTTAGTSPTPIQSTQAQKQETSTEQRPVKVAMLPRGGPTRGYAYLSSASLDIAVQTSKGMGKVSLYPHRVVASRITTYLAGKRKNSDHDTSDHDTPPTLLAAGDESGNRQILTISNGIEPREIERSIFGGYDWTRLWDWRLAVNTWAKDGNMRAWASLYFNDLPDLIGEGIPWKSRDKTQRMNADFLPLLRYGDDNFKFTWKFSERASPARWGGSFIVHHDLNRVLGGDDPWAFFASCLYSTAVLSQRTGAGRFKMVMWYDPWLGYGNDITGKPVEGVGAEGQTARYKAFVSRLSPYGS